jgi:hypothetical protein
MAKFAYEFRPAKHVERRLIADGLRRLDAIAPLRDFGYVGFGAFEFIDFDLFHRTLGIDDMVSIEKDTHGKERYLFNRPFGRIRLEMGTATQILPTLDWSKLKIVWLDYTEKLTTAMIQDCEGVVRECIPGSMLIVTMNAEPDKFGARRDALVRRVEEERVPPKIGEHQLGGWSLAHTQRRILSQALQHVAGNRTQKSDVQQVFNFRYADDARMQTIAWVLVAPNLVRGFENARFDELDFYRPDDEAVLIRVPVLTRRELAFLNDSIPVPTGAKITVPWLNQREVDDYAHYYRWYPSVV